METTPEKNRITKEKFIIAVAVILVTAIAAFLRVWGVNWGLPNSLHQLTYHPDEIFQVGAALRVDLLKLTLDPGFYNYPSGYINMGSFALRLASAYGMQIDKTLTGAYLVMRYLTVLTGVATVPFVYAAGAKFFGRISGILAALLIAIVPLHVVHSHFATVDVPATLWCTIALFCAAIILNKPSNWAYVIAGLSVGFAAGTKYNAALVVLPVIAAHFLCDRSERRHTRLVVMLVLCAVGFFISTPGFLLWPDKYIAGLQFELHHAASGHGQVFLGRGPGWLDVVTNSLGYGQGVALLVMSLIAVGYSIMKHKREDIVLLAFLVPYFLLISFSSVRFARYAIPILPPIMILTARMMGGLYFEAKKHAPVALRYLWVAACAAVVLYTTAYSIGLDRLFVGEDPRDEAARWFEANVTQGTSVAFPTVPWFYSPPLAPGITGAVGIENRYNLMSESKYKLMADPEEEWNASIITKDKPQYVVMSDFEYQDPLRLHDKNARRFFNVLNENYKEVHVFRRRITAFGIDFGWAECLPHDLKYMSPTIRVYRRK